MPTIVFNNQAVDYGSGSGGTLTVASGNTVSITSASAYYSTVNISGTLKISRLSDFRCSGTMTINAGGVVTGSETGGGNDGNWGFFGGLTGFSSTPGPNGGGGGGGGYVNGGNGIDGDGPVRGSNNDYGHEFAGYGGYAYGSLTGIITYFDNLIPLATYNGGNGGNGGSNNAPGVGGGSFKILAKTFINNGTIQANGTAGGSTASGGGSGGGGGGTIIIFTDSESGAGTYSAIGGNGGTGGGSSYYSNTTCDGGKGGDGRIIRYAGASTYSGTFAAGNTSAQSLTTLLFSDNPQAFSQTYPRLVWNKQIVDFGTGADGGLIVTGTTTLTSGASYNYSYISVNNGGILQIPRTAVVKVNGTVTVYSGGIIQPSEVGINTDAAKNGTGGTWGSGASYTYAAIGGGGGGGSVAGSIGGYVSGSSMPAVTSYGSGGGVGSETSSLGVTNYSDIINAAYGGGAAAWGSHKNSNDSGGSDGSPGAGAGVLKIICKKLDLQTGGIIRAVGGNGGNATGGDSAGGGERAGGGGGGGGTIWIICQQEIGGGTYNTSGGSGGSGAGNHIASGGAGGAGYIRRDYISSTFTGSTYGTIYLGTSVAGFILSNLGGGGTIFYT